MESLSAALLKVALIAGLMAANGFFVMAEFALVRVRPATLQHLAQRGSKRAKLALAILHDLDRYLSACQVGVTLASLLIGWIGEPTVREILVRPLFQVLQIDSEWVTRAVSFIFGTALVAAVLIVLGEQSPKYLALRQAEAASLFVAYPLHWFYVVMKPAIQVLDVSSNYVCNLLGVPRKDASAEVHSEEELRLILATSAHHGAMTPEKLNLLENVMEMSERTVRQVMVPRTEIAYFNLQKPLNENLKIAEKTAHSRYPLVDGDIDHVVGIVHMKDLFWHLRDFDALAAGAQVPSDRNPMLMGGQLNGNPTPSGAEFLRQIARKTFFVPETMRLDALLREFQRKRLHMAMVVDEYGGIAGLVTLENVIEAIVGQIQDEFDFELPHIQELSEREYSIDGVTSLAEVNHALSTEFADEEVDTIGGLILKQLGRMPAEGDTVEVNGIQLTVLKMENQRIARVLVRLPEPPETSEEASAPPSVGDSSEERSNGGQNSEREARES